MFQQEIIYLSGGIDAEARSQGSFFINIKRENITCVPPKKKKVNFLHNLINSLFFEIKRVDAVAAVAQVKMVIGNISNLFTITLSIYKKTPKNRATAAESPGFFVLLEFKENEDIGQVHQRLLTA
jgi:hypothetical protein